MRRRSPGLGSRFAAIIAVAALVALATLPSCAQSSVEGAPPTFQPKSQHETAPSEASVQATDPQKLSHAPNIRIQSILVTTPVTVIDHNGEFVSDLDESAFKVYDNGVPQQIQRFEISSEPIALVVVVQADDSVRPLLYQARGLAPIFSDLLVGPDGRVAVIGFSDKVTLLQDFSSKPDELKSTLAEVAASGVKTRLNDALMQAMRMLESRPRSERRLIVALSDGSDRGSDNSKAEVIYRASNDEVTIYSMHVSRAEADLRKPPPEDHPPNPVNDLIVLPTPPGKVPTSTNQGAVQGGSADPLALLGLASGAVSSKLVKSPLDYYAQFTGGTYYSHWSLTKLEDQLERVASEIHSQYEIAYKPTDLTGNGFHRIEVDVERPRLRVRARDGYFYQPQ
ncbi:MAG TPA: VWA domain-containing protein [Terriglobia bacterium]|nr:VWA domain-containing protein [Terriglobia bacterium]